MSYRVICPECGWMGEIEKSHTIVDGDVVHQCPVCRRRTYHFNATDAAKRLHDSCEDCGWFSSVNTDEDGCSLCWASAGLSKPDYYTLSIPEGWTDTTSGKCSTRQKGIDAELEVEGFVVSVSSVALFEAREHGKTKYHVGLTSPGRPIRKTIHHYVDSWGEGIEMANEWLAAMTAAKRQEIEQFIKEAQHTASVKNFKPGWVWYQVKNKFGVDVANRELPK